MTSRPIKPYDGKSVIKIDENDVELLIHMVERKKIWKNISYFESISE